jgi:hypothetical protein
MTELSYTEYFQSKLPQLSIDDIKDFVDIEYPGVSKDSHEFVKNHIWLGYQCCLGNFYEVLDFIDKCPKRERARYLSERSSEFWNGNLLHMVLYWNTGDKAFYMYTSLRELGAKLVEDKYDNYPWEFNTEIWTAPTLRDVYGKRDCAEFIELYHRIEQWELEHIEHIMFPNNNELSTLVY